MSDQTTTIDTLKQKLKKFVEERDWHQFHSPKNMSTYITIEAAELMELFVWLDNKGSEELFKEKRSEIEHEVADVAICLLMFCEENAIDLAKAIETKMVINAQKYPVEKAKGKATKYTDFKD